MDLKPIIDEIRSYWIGGETGGQTLLGGVEAHYNEERTPKQVLWAVRGHLNRKRLFSIAYWEIQAEEKSGNSWS